MAKGNNNKATTVAAATVVSGAGTPAATSKPGILAVKPGVSLRGARAAWYAVLLAHNGKPAAEFLATCAAQPPSLPKSGVAEKPQGWLGYFLRTGIAQVVPPTA